MSNDGDPAFDERLLEAFRDGLEPTFELSATSGADQDDAAAALRRFETLGGYEDVTLMNSWRVSDRISQTQLFFFKTVATFTRANKAGVYEVRERTHCAAVLIRLPTDLGSILIRPETIADKLVELFSSSEIDFDDHPEFSRRYYVLATDEDKARRGLTRKVLEVLSAEDGLLIEISGNLMLARFQKPLTPDVVQDLAKLGCALTRSVGY